MKEKQHPHKEVSQIGRFGLVGILNTIVDFVALNILAITILPKSLILGIISIFGNSYTITGLLIASIISGTLAMINSYIFNMRFTFRLKKVDKLHTFYFFIITIFGIFVLRPIIIKFFTDVWVWPVNVLYLITSKLSLPFSREFDERNFALFAAIALVLVYNYLMYKYIVFKSPNSNEKK